MLHRHGRAQGVDHTLYALIEGHIKFHYSKLARRRSVSIQPMMQG